MKQPSVHDVVKFLRRLSTRAGEGNGVTEAEAPMVDGLRVRGIVTGGHGRPLLLTELGRAFVRRHLAGADDFAAQHQNRVEATVESDSHTRQTVTVNLDESPLARLRHYRGGDGQPLIDAAEFTAGERLRADYTRGALTPRVTANWSAAVADSRRGGGAGGMADLTASVIAARRRVDDALKAVGPELAGVLVDFCCFLKGIEEIERERRWPARSAKLVIRLALAALARHYGLSVAAEGAARGGSLRHWGTTDYRPRIDGG